MPGPWEEYAEPSESEPWNEYAAPKPARQAARPAAKPAAKPASPTLRTTPLAADQPTEVEEVVVAGKRKPKSLRWRDVPEEAARNIIPSAVGVVKDLAQVVMHPIQTAKGIGDIGAGVLQYMDDAKVRRPHYWEDMAEDINRGRKWAKAPLVTPEQLQAQYAKKRRNTAQADAVGKFLADRYGGMEQLKTTLARDPVGFLADASTVLTGGGAAAARAPGLIGKAGRIAKVAGETVDPLAVMGRTANLGAKGAGLVASEAVGFGRAGGEAVREAVRSGAEGGTRGQAFVEQMRNPDAEVLVDQAREGVDALRQKRAQEYAANMASVNAVATPIPFNTIQSAVQRVKDRGFYKGVSKNPKAAGAWEDLDAAVTEWAALNPADYHTPEGLDALKQKIGSIQQSYEVGSPARSAADSVYAAVKGAIVQQAPEYAKAMKDYESASAHLRELEGALSVKNKTLADTAMRKLRSVLQTGNENRRSLVKGIDEVSGKNLEASVAGYGMSQPMPANWKGAVAGGLAGGAAGLVNPAFGLAALTASPRLVGETSYALGRAASPVAKGAMAAINSPAGKLAAKASPAMVSEVGRLTQTPEELRALTEKYKNRPGEGPEPEIKKDGPDFSKMSDEELDAYIREHGGQDPKPLEPIVSAIEGVEGGPNAGANLAGTSSATGPGQFTKDTFLATYKAAFPDSGMSDDEIKALHGTPEGDKVQHETLLPLLTDQNAKSLESDGFDITPASLYLAHFLGAVGAKRLLAADPSAAAEEVVSPSAVEANRSVLQGKTVADVLEWAARKMAEYGAQG